MSDGSVMRPERYLNAIFDFVELLANDLIPTRIVHAVRITELEVDIKNVVSGEIYTIPVDRNKLFSAHFDGTRKLLEFTESVLTESSSKNG